MPNMSRNEISKRPRHVFKLVAPFPFGIVGIGVWPL